MTATLDSIEARVLKLERIMYVFLGALFPLLGESLMNLGVI